MIPCCRSRPTLPERNALARVASLIAVPAWLLTTLAPLLPTLPWFPRMVLALRPIASRSLVVTLRSWWLLLTLGRALRWLLPLGQGYWATPLRRRVRGSGPLLHLARVRCGGCPRGAAHHRIVFLTIEVTLPSDSPVACTTLFSCCRW